MAEENKKYHEIRMKNNKRIKKICNPSLMINERLQKISKTRWHFVENFWYWPELSDNFLNIYTYITRRETIEDIILFEDKTLKVTSA